MAELAGKRALITGGLGTIGRALAQVFQSAGAEVTLLDRPGGSAPAEMGWIGVDLGDLAAATRAVEGSAFDILINNAAVILNRPYEAVSLDDYDREQRVNASAAFALIKALAPGMQQRGWGRIINLTSITLNGQWDGFVPYVASKGALHGLTKAFARELGAHGITVNAIAPGAVRSEAEDRVYADRLVEYNDWILSHQSLKQRIAPEDIAEAALFLASDRARMISGQTLKVDGGW